MLRFVGLCFGMLGRLFRSRPSLLLENLALRQQLVTLRENIYITTSGNFRTQALTDVMLEVGADRVLYSVDYPFEDMREAANWFDQAAISEPDRLKIAS